MIRSAIIAVAFLAAGAAIGWVAAPALQEPGRLASPPAPASITVPNDEIDRLKADRERLEAENEDLVAQITQLLDQQSQWFNANGPVASVEEERVAVAETSRSGDGQRREVDSEEARTRREAYMRENARRMQEFEDWIASQITDPAGIERYNALMEWQEYQDELRRQFRDAETDEERDALRSKMEDARRTARQMVRDQQDAMLQDIAAANGVTNPEKQTEFVEAMRKTLENPFFEMESMLAGGGSPGRGGYPLGGRRGEGRPPGQFQSSGQN